MRKGLLLPKVSLKGSPGLMLVPFERLKAQCSQNLRALRGTVKQTGKERPERVQALLGRGGGMVVVIELVGRLSQKSCEQRASRGME